MLKNEDSAKVVAERLGDTVATIMATYAHVLPGTHRDSAIKLNNLLAPIKKDSDE